MRHHGEGLCAFQNLLLNKSSCTWEKTFSGQRPAVTLPQLSYYESCYLNNSDVNNFFFQNPTFLTSLSPFTWSSPRLRAGINFHFTVWKKQAHILWWFFCAHSSCWLSSQKTLGLTENISLFYFFFSYWGDGGSSLSRSKFFSIRRKNNTALFIILQNKKYCSCLVCHFEMFRTSHALLLQHPPLSAGPGKYFRALMINILVMSTIHFALYDVIELP